MSGFPVLSAIMLSSFLGVVGIMLLPPDKKTAIKTVALISTGISFLLSIYVFFHYDTAKGGIQFLESIPWLPEWGITYKLGVDGLSVPMILLNATVIFCGVMVSWHFEKKVKEFFATLIFLATGVFGVFMTQDLFFFALFYEIAVLPMYLLIGIWGSGEKKEYAAYKLTLMLFFGSAFMMTGILLTYKVAGLNTFDLMKIKEMARFSPKAQKAIFFLYMLGFGTIIPMWPFHTWSPEGHAAAPTSASMLHAGVLMKLGGFGLLRIAIPLCPVGLKAFAPYIIILAMFNIVYGAVTGVAQKDLKFLIGFSSVSHMGMVLFGIATLTLIGMTGAAFEMFAHGFMTALFFASVELFYKKTHNRMVDELGGIGNVMPKAAFFFGVAGLACVGLPGFVNFVSEFMVFFGGFKSHLVLSLIALTSIAVTSFFVVRALQRTHFGNLNPKWSGLKDATVLECTPLIILSIMLVVFGFFPGVVVKMFHLETASIISKLGLGV